MMINKKCFTLAEILITLAIIGVVASITIPAIINSTKEAEYNASVKKVMSELSGALTMIQNNNGGAVNVGNGNSNADHTAMRNEFCNVMNCAKKGTGSEIFGNTVYKHYGTGDYGPLGTSSNDSAMLNNGTLLQFNNFIGCNNWGVNMCAYIYADVNGAKEPNRWGKDTYIFYVVKNPNNNVYSIVPAGVPQDTEYRATSWCKKESGYGCAALRLYNPEKLP